MDYKAFSLICQSQREKYRTICTRSFSNILDSLHLKISHFIDRKYDQKISAIQRNIDIIKEIVYIILYKNLDKVNIITKII